jgi:hypothetical protein
MRKFLKLLVGERAYLEVRKAMDYIKGDEEPPVLDLNPLFSPDAHRFFADKVAVMLDLSGGVDSSFLLAIRILIEDEYCGPRISHDYTSSYDCIYVGCDDPIGSVYRYLTIVDDPDNAYILPGYAAITSPVYE